MTQLIQWKLIEIELLPLKLCLRLPENVWPLAFEIAALLTCSTMIPWLLRRSLGCLCEGSGRWNFL